MLVVNGNRTTPATVGQRELVSLGQLLTLHCGHALRAAVLKEDAKLWIETCWREHSAQCAGGTCATEL